MTGRRDDGRCILSFFGIPPLSLSLPSSALIAGTPHGVPNFLNFPSVLFDRGTLALRDFLLVPAIDDFFLLKA